MEELTNSSPTNNTSPIDPPKKTFRSVGENLGKTNQFTNLAKEYSNNLYYNTGFGESKYDEVFNFDAQFNETDPLGSINENRAQLQSPWAKAALGVSRAVVKAGSEIAKIPGVVGGLIGGTIGEISDLTTGEDNNDFIRTAFDNAFINSVTKLNDIYNEDIAPVYVKKAVSEGNLWDNISSVDFWATDAADGIGYIASMMVPGALLKGAGVGRAIAQSSPLRGVVSASQADVATATIANTLLEAGSEANSAMTNFQIDLDRRLESGELDEAEYNNLLEQKSILGRDVFVSNVAILAGPNFLQSSMLWGKAANKGVGKLFNDKGELIQNVINPKTYQKVANRLKNISGAVASEGFLEEAGQSTVETMFSQSASRGELTNNFFKDFNLDEVKDNYLNTISSTEGQKAIFLGGFLGGGMSAYHGAKQDVRNRNDLQNLLDKGNNAIDAYYNIINPSVYNQNTSQLNPEEVLKKLTASDNTDKMSAIYEQAVANGDLETIDKLREIAGTQLAYSFIMNDELGLDVLQEHLNQSSQMQDLVEQEQTINPQVSKQAIIDDIMDKARTLQKAYSSYQEFAPALLQDSFEELNNINPELGNKYYNTLAQNYINNKAQIGLVSKELNKAEQQYRDVLNDLGYNENIVIDPDNYTVSINRPDSVDVSTLETSDYRLRKSKKDIVELSKKLKDLKEIDSNFWKKNVIDKNTKRFKEDNQKLIEDFSQENQDKINSEVEQINNATTEEQIDEVKPTNPVVKQQAQEKKKEIKQVQINNENIERQQIVADELGVQVTPEVESQLGSLFDEVNPGESFEQAITRVENQQPEYIRVDNFNIAKGTELFDRTDSEEEYFTKKRWKSKGTIKAFKVGKSGENLEAVLMKGEYREYWLNKGEWWGYYVKNPLFKNATYNELSSSEGSEFTDELIPNESDNNSLEELKTINTGDIDNGKGVKVISTNRNTGEPLDFITEQFPNYIQYEREPVNKQGREVSFEINQNPGNVSREVKEALELYNKNDFSNPKFLFDYLPINVRFTPEVNAPIETKRKNGDIDYSTELLRIDIISKLIQGQPIDNIKGSIQDQYKGLLQIESSTAENNILQLDGVKDLNYIRENLYVVNSQGLLQNIISGKTQSFQNPFTKDLNRAKESARGEIYLTIPQANGKPFPLKLNIKKLSPNDASILYDIYKEILNNEKALNTSLIEISDELRNKIVDNFTEELKIIGGNIQDITLGSIIDLMIYQSPNIKSQMRVENGVLYFGNQTANMNNIDSQRDNIINFLTTVKRHQVKISPKSETDNLKTNLQSNSADYLKYLVNNNILSTNAVINQPTFQGYTNIYLNPTTSLQSNVKPISNIQERLSKINTLDGLTEAYNSLNPEQQGLYKQNFTDRKKQIINKPVVSEQGVETDSKNFEGINFDTGEVIIQDKGLKKYNNNIEKLRKIDDLLAARYILRSGSRIMLYGSETSALTSAMDITYKEAENLSSLLLEKGKKENWKFGDSYDYSDLDYKINNIINSIQEDSGAEFVNNDEIVRNSQENLVPLSQIPGTMENTTVEEVQDEVYEVPSDARERNEDIKRLISLNKKIQSGKELRPNELKDFNKFKNAYPQEFEKRCK